MVCGASVYSVSKVTRHCVCVRAAWSASDRWKMSDFVSVCECGSADSQRAGHDEFTSIAISMQQCNSFTQMEMSNTRRNDKSRLHCQLGGKRDTSRQQNKHDDASNVCNVYARAVWVAVCVLVSVSAFAHVELLTVELNLQRIIEVV